MRPWPHAWQVSSSSAGATAEEGTAPVQPTSSGDSSPAGAVCGVAVASTAPSWLSTWAAAGRPGDAVVAAARGATTRSAPQASQKLDSAGFAVPQTGQSRDAVDAVCAVGAAGADNPAGPALVAGSGAGTGADWGAPVVGMWVTRGSRVGWRWPRRRGERARTGRGFAWPAHAGPPRARRADRWGCPCA